DERRRVRRPLDHIDLLAVQLVHNVLDTHAAHPDARADWIDLLLARRDGHLGAQSRLSGNGHDFDRAAVDLRDLQLEEAADQVGMGPRDDELRTTRVLVDLQQVDLQALTDAVALIRHLLAGGHDRLRLAEIDNDRLWIGALDDAVQDLTDAINVLGVDAVTLVVADTLQHDLLGRLRRDAPKVLRCAVEADNITHDRVRVSLACLFDRDFRVRVLDLFHDPLDDEDPDAALVGVEGGVDLNLDFFFRTRHLL